MDIPFLPSYKYYASYLPTTLEKLSSLCPTSIPSEYCSHAINIAAIGAVVSLLCGYTLSALLFTAVAVLLYAAHFFYQQFQSVSAENSKLRAENTRLQKLFQEVLSKCDSLKTSMEKVQESCLKTIFRLNQCPKDVKKALREYFQETDFLKNIKALNTQVLLLKKLDKNVLTLLNKILQVSKKTFINTETILQAIQAK